MQINILMPALSPTMEQGTLIKWFVTEGDKINSGDIIAEIETDKATMEFEVIEDGTLTKILIPEGTEGVKVNEVLAILDDGEENTDETQTNIAPSEKLDNEIIKNTEIDSCNSDEDSSVKLLRLKASPLARKIAKINNINLSNILGTGPGGRIVKKDLESSLNKSTSETPNLKEFSENHEKNISKTSNSSVKMDEKVELTFSGRKFESVPINKIRKIVAQRLTESKQTIPHFYLRRTINVQKLLDLRTDLNNVYQAEGIKISINDFIINACAKALQEHPKCNSIWAFDKLLRLHPSDIAVAVAIEDGIVTPVLRDVEVKSLKQIHLEMKEFVTKAKNRSLLPDEYTGASFAISNLGMMGIENFDAVINPPQSSILAVGTCTKKPIVVSNKIKLRSVMSVTLSVDHRVIDGAVGAGFLDTIVNYLEEPIRLII